MSTRQFHYEVVPGGIQLQMLLEQKGLLWGKTNTSDVPLSHWCSDNQLNIVLFCCQTLISTIFILQLLVDLMLQMIL